MSVESTGDSSSSDLDLFRSAADLRAHHNELLPKERMLGDDSAEAEAFCAAVSQFVAKACRTGAILESFDDRSAAQQLIDYWANYLHRQQIDSVQEFTDETLLAPFSDALAARELESSDNPFLDFGTTPRTPAELVPSRRQTVARCLAILRKHRLLVVCGPIGSGVSTLVRTGIVGELRAGRIARRTDWQLETLDASANLGTQLRSLESAVKSEPRIIVVDRFELLFGVADVAERQRLCNQLVAWSQRSEQHDVVILQLRSGFRSRLAELDALRPIADDVIESVRPFDGAELAQALQERADRAGVNSPMACSISWLAT